MQNNPLLAEGVVTWVSDAPETAQEVKPKVVHGVPVDAWVLSQRDAISMNKVPPPAPSNIRFFLQCLELKEGLANELKERDCRELAAKNTPRPAGYIN